MQFEWETDATTGRPQRLVMRPDKYEDERLLHSIVDLVESDRPFTLVTEDTETGDGFRTKFCEE